MVIFCFIFLVDDKIDYINGGFFFYYYGRGFKYNFGGFLDDCCIL